MRGAYFQQRRREGVLKKVNGFLCPLFCCRAGIWVYLCNIIVPSKKSPSDGVAIAKKQKSMPRRTTATTSILGPAAKHGHSLSSSGVKLILSSSSFCIVTMFGDAPYTTPIFIESAEDHTTYKSYGQLAIWLVTTNRMSQYFKETTLNTLIPTKITHAEFLILLATRKQKYGIASLWGITIHSHTGYS